MYVALKENESDIIYYSTDSGYHVMIVPNIEIVDCNREIELKDIKVIESTHENALKLFGVGNKNDLDFYNSRRLNWYLGRIKQNEN